MSLLEVKDLSVQLQTKSGFATAVDRLSFSLDSGEILGIAGESGSGKTKFIRPYHRGDGHIPACL